MKTIFSHRLEVRFRDCDPMGHVNNAVYLTYLEQARFQHWRSLWGFRRKDPPSAVPGVILARVEIDYKSQARDGDQLEVRIGLSAIGRTSFSYEYEIVDAHGTLVAAARSVQVMFDYAAGKPVPVPAEISAMLLSHDARETTKDPN
jgi:acyl-CoA thioester hydrolase